VEAKIVLLSIRKHHSKWQVVSKSHSLAEFSAHRYFGVSLLYAYDERLAKQTAADFQSASTWFRIPRTCGAETALLWATRVTSVATESRDGSPAGKF